MKKKPHQTKNPHVCPQAQNCILYWWLHLSKAGSPRGGLGRDPSRQGRLDEARRWEEMRQVGGMLGMLVLGFCAEGEDGRRWVCDGILR